MSISNLNFAGYTDTDNKNQVRNIQKKSSADQKGKYHVQNFWNRRFGDAKTFWKWIKQWNSVLKSSFRSSPKSLGIVTLIATYLIFPASLHINPNCFFPIWIPIVLIYQVWETSRNKPKKHSVSKTVLTFHFNKLF